VAGIAAAKTDNGAGVAGVCPECRLLNAKVCSDGGDCPHDRIANGVLWSVGCEWRERDAGGKLGKCLGPVRARVINISLASTAGSTTLQRAMDRAAELDATLACAAGNNGSTSRMYPAAYDACIAAAATTSRDQKLSISNYGSWVEVGAPGGEVYSTMPGGGYGLKSGTSMASPHVAGLAGLLRSRGVATARDAVRARIEGTADRISGTGTQWAKGRINACRAMTNNGPACQ
jgi:thermitase